MTLGEILRARRRSLGFTATAIALDLNITPAYIRMIERGERVPSQQLLERWLRYFDLTFEIFERSISIQGHKAIPLPKSNDEPGSSISSQVLHELAEIRALLEQLTK